MARSIQLQSNQKPHIHRVELSLIRSIDTNACRLFLTYFAGESIELLDGGIDSGFHHVEVLPMSLLRSIDRCS